MTVEIKARPLGERRQAAYDILRTHHHLWLATGGTGVGAHLIPVSYVWDGERLTMATFARSRTAANLRASHRARVAIGQPLDVVMIDGEVAFVAVPDVDATIADRFAEVSHDPRIMPGFSYLTLVPDRVLVWNGFHEHPGRTVMLDGVWLDEPVD